MNDYIPHEFGSLEYVTIDEAIDAVVRTGRGAILVKRDLSDAFRHIPIALSDRWLLGFSFDDTFHEEQSLLFGLRTAPFLFDLFARGLNWILVAVLCWSVVIHYLDDFLAVLAPNADVNLYKQHFDMLCRQLGLAVNHKKDVEGTVADFLGLEIDNIAMQLRLPKYKLVRGEGYRPEKSFPEKTSANRALSYISTAI